MALKERAPLGVKITALGRPAIDLTNAYPFRSKLLHHGFDAVINAAAYTAVDKAETEANIAMCINGRGAKILADFAAELGVPLVHLSTDYVFDGKLERPYKESDSTNPLSVYGRSKLQGEQAIAEAYQNHAILRTSWVYSPFGTNFLKTMLRLGEAHTEVGVVSDQIGNPTSAIDIADAALDVSARLCADASSDLRGVFHMTGSGEASWADFAEAIFAEAEKYGRRPVHVKRISTIEYPTAAERPANSRLDNGKLRNLYGLTLPSWRRSLSQCISRLCSPVS